MIALSQRRRLRRADRLGGLRLFDQVSDDLARRADRQAEAPGEGRAGRDRRAAEPNGRTSRGPSACRRWPTNISISSSSTSTRSSIAQSCPRSRRGSTRSAASSRRSGSAAAATTPAASEPAPTTPKGKARMTTRPTRAEAGAADARSRAFSSPRRSARATRACGSSRSAFVCLYSGIGARLVYLGFKPDPQSMRRAAVEASRRRAARHSRPQRRECWRPTSRPCRCSPSRAASSTRTRRPSC